MTLREQLTEGERRASRTLARILWGVIAFGLVTVVVIVIQHYT